MKSSAASLQAAPDGGSNGSFGSFGSSGNPEPSAAGVVYLHPGEMFASRQPHLVTTILGSCVAVTLYAPEIRAGGINHFMLPQWSGAETASLRFGNVAIVQLIEQVLKLGAVKRDLNASLYGGACVIGAFRTGGQHLGEKNVELARKLLRAEGIRVINEHVGGTRGLRLKFRTDTGECRVYEIGGG